jgi:hypothetical protein
MTTPHPEQPAEGPDEPGATEPADDDAATDGDSIDNDPAST